jgi:hypothetical protein
MSTTAPDVFIIESLDLEDEGCDRPEGRRIADMLRLGKKNCQYYYVRTKREVKELLKVFQASRYRYLHLSTHGVVERNHKLVGLSTTFDQIRTDELGELLRPYINRRRVFLSACNAGSKSMATALLHDTTCHSVMAPCRSVGFGDMAIFWVAFYYAMFQQDNAKMNNTRIEETGTAAAKLFKIHMKLFITKDGAIRSIDLK